VYAAACARASLLDEQTAAKIRFEHSIPTLYPRTQAHALNLGTCSSCGRPWQADPDGACEHCPRLLYGPTPSNSADAARFPAPHPVTPEQLADPLPVDD
jgi:hypothetical protein